jgi:hypothetical protein
MFWQLILTITFTTWSGTTVATIPGFRDQAACRTYATDLASRISQAPQPIRLNNDPRLEVKSIDLSCQQENQV